MPPGGGDGGDPPNPPGNNPNPQIPPANAAFSLTPGLANTGVLDYGTKLGRSIYGYSTAKLEETLYDCDPEGFFQFMKSIQTRADEYGWTKPNGILDVNGANLLTLYGTLSMETLQAREASYLFTHTRKAQDNRMLYQCLVNSLSLTGKAKLNLHRADYFMEELGGGQSLPSGILYLKVLIRESFLDTNATTSSIRTKLSNLDSAILTYGNNVTKFNAYVNTLVQTLASRGESSQDLLQNLFKGYASCSDRRFVAYIQKKQEDYDEGKPMTSASLMQLADTKYKQLIEKEQWEAPSPEEEKITALEARLSELNKQIQKKRKIAEGKGKGKGQDPKSKKNKKEKPSWMTVKPTDVNAPREWNGKTWHWCGAETGGKCDPPQYRCHKPAECKGTAKKGKTNNKTKRDNQPPKVTIKEAIDQVDNDEEDGYLSS